MRKNTNNTGRLLRILAGAAFLTGVSMGLTACDKDVSKSSTTTEKTTSTPEGVKKTTETTEKKVETEHKK